MSRIEGLDGKGPDAEVMDFVEQMGGYFEANGLTRLAGRLLGPLCSSLTAGVVVIPVAHSAVKVTIIDVLLE